jgi:hypothetical protein
MVTVQYYVHDICTVHLFDTLLQHLLRMLSCVQFYIHFLFTRYNIFNTQAIAGTASTVGICHRYINGKNSQYSYT